MLKINKTTENTTVVLTLGGRLDTTTAPELEKAVAASYEGITELIIDMKELDYVSSAGLRVLLAAQKTMNKQGSMTIRNVNEAVMEIFEITGFLDILTIEGAN